MNKVIDKGFRSCRFVSTIVKHPVYTAAPCAHPACGEPHTQCNANGEVATEPLQSPFCKR